MEPHVYSWPQSACNVQTFANYPYWHLLPEGKRGDKSKSWNCAVWWTDCVVLTLAWSVHKDKKVNLSLCFNWAPRHEGVLGEWRYSSTHSLTSALDGGEWSASRPDRFTPKERVPGTHRIGGWVGPRAGLDNQSTNCSYNESSLLSSVSDELRPVMICCTVVSQVIVLCSLRNIYLTFVTLRGGFWDVILLQLLRGIFLVRFFWR
jgi:hypothetical protein